MSVIKGLILNGTSIFSFKQLLYTLRNCDFNIPRFNTVNYGKTCNKLTHRSYTREVFQEKPMGSLLLVCFHTLFLNFIKNQ